LNIVTGSLVTLALRVGTSAAAMVTLVCTEAQCVAPSSRALRKAFRSVTPEVFNSAPGGLLSCSLVPTGFSTPAFVFSSLPEGPDELIQVCLIRVETKLCCTVALQEKDRRPLCYTIRPGPVTEI